MSASNDKHELTESQREFLAAMPRFGSMTHEEANEFGCRLMGVKCMPDKLTAEQVRSEYDRLLDELETATRRLQSTWREKAGTLSMKCPHDNTHQHNGLARWCRDCRSVVAQVPC